MAAKKTKKIPYEKVRQLRDDEEYSWSAIGEKLGISGWTANSIYEAQKDRTINLKHQQSVQESWRRKATETAGGNAQINNAIAATATPPANTALQTALTALVNAMRSSGTQRVVVDIAAGYAEVSEPRRCNLMGDE